MNVRFISFFIWLSLTLQGYAQRTPREVAGWLGVGWNLGNQMDADSRYWLNIAKAARDEEAKRLLLNEFTAVWRQIAMV